MIKRGEMPLFSFLYFLEKIFMKIEKKLSKRWLQLCENVL